MSSDGSHVRQKGVVYTPESIADEITRVALDTYGAVPCRVLEPSAGEGAFVGSLVSRELAPSSITAIDVDGDVVRSVRDSYPGVEAIHGDFLDYALEREKGAFELIIGNPPFLKRRDCGTEFRSRLGDAGDRTGFPARDLKNAWAAFAVVGAGLLDSGGVLALVVPHQILTAQYGRAVQAHLAKIGFELDVFAPDSTSFSSIEQEAVLLVARRRGNGAGGVRVSRIADLAKIEPSACATVDILANTAAAIDVKSILLDGDTTELLRGIRSEWARVGDYCESAAGIVTAANRDFILHEDDAERFGLKPWVRRILQKGGHLPAGPVLSSEQVAKLARTLPCNLVDFCREGAPPLSAEARRFIEDCEAKGIHDRYKCQRRSPWYNIPIVEPGDGLFFKRANLYPRLCVNEASILATDAAYQVRMGDGYRMRDLCFSFYNSITLIFAEVDGRSYFSGVLELTPTEFRGLPLHLVTPTRDEFVAFETAFLEGKRDVEAICAACDQRLCEELRIPEDDMARVREGLKALRRHRRRHGNGAEGGGQGEADGVRSGRR